MSDTYNVCTMVNVKGIYVNYMLVTINRMVVTQSSRAVASSLV